MRPFVIDIDVADVDANGICESQTPALGGVQTLTLDGALISGGSFTTADYARRVGVTSVGDDSGRTFTFTGTDQNGDATTEAVTGANANVAETTTYWKTITSITTDDDTAAAITVGTVDEVSTADIPMSWSNPNAANVSVNVTGTIDFTVQESFTPIEDPTWTSLYWIDVTALADKTAPTTSTLTAGCTAMRVVVNNYSSGAELQAYVTLPRYD